MNLGEMDREPSDPAPKRGALAESWREVGEQLQELGTRLAAAFRAAWSAERSAEQEETVRDLRDDLRAAADRLDRIMKRMAAETEPQRSAALRATRDASERSLGEARSAAVTALRSLNRQLDALAARLEREREEQQPKALPEQRPDDETEPPRSGS